LILRRYLINIGRSINVCAMMMVRVFVKNAVKIYMRWVDNDDIPTLFNYFGLNYLGLRH